MDDPKNCQKTFFAFLESTYLNSRKNAKKIFFIFFSLYDGLGLRKFYCILLIIARVGIIEINAMIEIIEIIILIEIIEIIILIIDIEIVALNKSMKLRPSPLGRYSSSTSVEAYSQKIVDHKKLWYFHSNDFFETWHDDKGS